MNHIARFLLRAYLRLVGAYIDRRHIAWANDTAEEEEE